MSYGFNDDKSKTELYSDWVDLITPSADFPDDYLKAKKVLGFVYVIGDLHARHTPSSEGVESSVAVLGELPQGMRPNKNIVNATLQSNVMTTSNMNSTDTCDVLTDGSIKSIIWYTSNIYPYHRVRVNFMFPLIV